MGLSWDGSECNEWRIFTSTSYLGIVLHSKNVSSVLNKFSNLCLRATQVIIYLPRTLKFLCYVNETFSYHKVQVYYRNILLKKNNQLSWAWWVITSIPTSWDLNQEECHKFKVSPCERVRLFFKRQKTKSNKTKENNWPTLWCHLACTASLFSISDGCDLLTLQKRN